MQQVIRCPNCGSPNPPGQRFCNVCGANMASGCPNCGAPLDPASRFCGNCGATWQDEGYTKHGKKEAEHYKQFVKMNWKNANSDKIVLDVLMREMNEEVEDEDL